MKALSHPLLHRSVGLVLGAVFLYASFDKIARPADFARIIYHYQVIGPSQVLPPILPNLFAVALPWVEAVAGLLLVAGVWRREAALTAGAMLVVFLVAVGSALYRGVDVRNCGCFSVSQEGRQAGWLLIGEDAILLAGAALLAAVRTRPPAHASAREAVSPPRVDTPEQPA